MALIDLDCIPYPPSEGDDDVPLRPQLSGQRLGVPGPDACPREADAVYLLIYNDPAAPVAHCAGGWWLSASTRGVLRWNAALSAHGAGVSAIPRHAKAVAVRVLRERGVPVQSWSTAPHCDDRPAFHAVLEHPDARGVREHRRAGEGTRR